MLYSIANEGGRSISNVTTQLNLLGNRMPKKGEKRDPLLDCPAIIKYREVVHLQLNYLQRQAVAEVIRCDEKGLRLWEAVLVERMLNGNNPKNVPSMLKQWELEYYG